MPEPESPQVRRDRLTALVATAVVCLAVPSVALLVYDVPGTAPSRVAATGLVAGAAAGVLLPLLYWGPYRALGFVPPAATGWVVAAAYGVVTGHWPGWAQGVPLGLVVGALARGRRGPDPAAETVALAVAVAAGVGVAALFVSRGRPFDVPGYLVLAAAAGLTLWAWARLFRPLFELALEPVLWWMYRVRATGPGLAAILRTGPCLVIANHACWFDPIFLAKILPRPVTPMMTARFYDLPVMRRLMVAFGVIRVPDRALKKEVPEVREAIAALDRGECVLIFPDGYLRRSEERVLRRFGQGVWQILKARPDTPVFACWIEGGWGSYTSYFNGPPTKNKKRDFRRPIAVGVSDPVTVPAEILADHLKARLHLMNEVSAARAHLGLAPLPPFEAHTQADEKADAPDEPGASPGLAK